MKANWLVGTLLGCLASSCGVTQDVQHRPSASEPVVATDDDEVAIALDQVPEAIRTAATAAVAGFVLQSAEKETEEGALHYCLEGTASGERVEIEVDVNGKVLEIERGDDDDDGDGDDGDDDDDDDGDDD